MSEALYWLFVQQSSWIVLSLSLFMTVKMGDKRWWAPWIGVVSQIFWIILGNFTGQPAIILAALLYGFVHARNGVKWWKERGDSISLRTRLSSLMTTAGAKVISVAAWTCSIPTWSSDGVRYSTTVRNGMESTTGARSQNESI